MITYSFVMGGRAADDQSWRVDGEVFTTQEGNFSMALDEAQREAFMKLTQGKAVYGQPGVGCRGPYKIDYLNIKRKEV